MKKLLTVAAIAAVALVFASSAMANALSCAHGSTCQGNLGSGQSGGKGNSGGSVSGGTLPFTGLDLAAVAGVGAVLFASGLALRRAGRKPQPESADVS